METRRIIAFLLILLVVAGLSAVRMASVRSRRRERRRAAKPIEIVADTHEG